jgi:hypothetical protein
LLLLELDEVEERLRPATPPAADWGSSTAGSAHASDAAGPANALEASLWQLADTAATAVGRGAQQQQQQHPQQSSEFCTLLGEPGDDADGSPDFSFSPASAQQPQQQQQGQPPPGGGGGAASSSGDPAAEGHPAAASSSAAPAGLQQSTAAVGAWVQDKATLWWNSRVVQVRAARRPATLLVRARQFVCTRFGVCHMLARAVGRAACPAPCPRPPRPAGLTHLPPVASPAHPRVQDTVQLLHMDAVEPWQVAAGGTVAAVVAYALYRERRGIRRGLRRAAGGLAGVAGMVLGVTPNPMAAAPSALRH